MTPFTLMLGTALAVLAYWLATDQDDFDNVVQP